MRVAGRLFLIGILVTALAIAWFSIPARHHDESAPPDDAKAAGMTVADLPETSAELFNDMDGGIALTEDERKGRNSWILWTAGNQLFWDRLARKGYGILDLIKTLDTRRRSHRFAEMGLINEPGFEQATEPDQFGLWLDKRSGSSPAGIDERIYGRASGVIGFRIFPNPDFNDQAKRHWDADRYYSDPSYFNDPALVRPYRIGVACGLCHVGPNPVNPPADAENPRWSNLSSAIGNKYIREGKVFTLEKPGSFLWEMLNAQPPGTSDTSRVVNDHINNPGAINAIFMLATRMDEATEEEIAGGALDWPGKSPRKVPHLLKDGADSVGPAAAMLRVYVNEGLYSQLWMMDHDILLGLEKQKPFSVVEAFRNSTYWQATYARTDNIAKFFVRLAPMHLEDAPGGRDYITADQAIMDRGKIVFAENCATCHSSKQPPANIAARSPEGLQWYRESAMRADFRDNNFLSSEKRYSVSLIKTNACRALGTNATRGQIWDNFSSETYKSLPSIGAIEVYDPANPSIPYRFQAPSGGVGYYRPPSLISIWAMAPFLHNRSVGVFDGDPSVAGRMREFNDAIEKLLWPEKRLGTKSISRTTETSYIRIAEAYVPAALRPLAKDGFVSVGPIPKGTPINLLANIDPTLPNALALFGTIKATLVEMADNHLEFSPSTSDSHEREIVTRLTMALMSASKCPDLVEDRGHEFGAKLPDVDKHALIEFLKTL